MQKNIIKVILLISIGLLLISYNRCCCLPSKNVNSDYSIRNRTIVDSLLNLALHYKGSSVEKSKALTIQAINLAKKNHYLEGEIEALLHLANLDISIKKYLDALQEGYKAFEISKVIKSKKHLMLSTERLGYIFLEVGNVELASKYILQCWDLAVDNNDTTELIRLYQNFGDLEKKKKNLDAAFKNLYLGLYLSQLQKNDFYISRIYKQLGTLYLEQHKYNNALYYFKKALSTTDMTLYDHDLGSIYTLIAHTLQIQGQFSEARLYYSFALEDRQNQDRELHYISSLLNIGNLYLDAKKYDSSFYYLNKGLRLLEINESNYLKEYGYFQLYLWYYHQERYLEALQTYIDYSNAKEKVAFEKNRNDLIILEATKYQSEIEQKNKLLEYENAVQELKIKFNKRATALFLIIISVSIVLVLVFTWLYLKTKRSREALERLNKQLDKEINDRKQAEINLKVSEASYRFLADNTPDLIVHMDSRNRLVYISPNCPQVLGYPIDEMMERFDPLLIIHPEYHEAMKGLYEDMVSSGEPTLFTYEALRKDGSLFWVESLAKPLFDLKTGRFNGTLIVNRDIAERVKYEEQLSENARQKEVLLREIHHRVKNNFAILAGVMTLQRISAENKELTNLINDLQTRIRSMSLVHELLYKNDNLDVIPFDIYLMQLSNIVASGNRSKPVSLIYNLEPCVLDIEIVLPLGLVVTELLTNAFKYAFTGTGPNELTLELAIHETDDKNNPVKWKLILRDNGKGLPEGFSMENVTTLGTSIVNMLVTQVEGTVAARNENGACFEIIFNNYIEKSSRLNDRK